MVELAHGHGRLAHAVAQHGHAVGELEHLVEVVGDVQDRDAALAEPVDHVEQPPHVGARQRRRRLVEDQQAGAVLPADQGAGDRDRRALRRRAGSCTGALMSRSPRPSVASASRVRRGLFAPVDAAAETRSGSRP